MSTSITDFNLIRTFNPALRKTYSTNLSITENKEDLLIFNDFGTNEINNLNEILNNDISFYIYGENKKIDEKFNLCSSNNQEVYDFEADAKQTAAELKEVIYDNSLNRSKKVLNFFKDNLDPANIDLVLQEYKKLTGTEDIQKHLDIVFWGHPFKKKEIEKILNSLLNFENLNTKIDNKYWQGDSHNVTREGSVFTITNTETNETREIDLAVLLKNFDTSKERKNFVEQLQKLPAEVLMDIAAEQTTLIALDDNTEVNVGNNQTCIAAGYYTPGSDQVALQDDSSIDTITHETGHALDFNKLKGSNSSSVTKNKYFIEIFNEEMENYLADGNERYSYGNSSPRNTYATTNEREMFAECYTLLMTGDCGSKETIEKYFPRMLGYIKQLVEFNRSHSNSIRH